MIRKNLRRYALAALIALALLIAGILLPGLAGALPAFGAAALAAVTLRAMIREDRRWEREKDARG